MARLFGCFFRHRWTRWGWVKVHVNGDQYPSDAQARWCKDCDFTQTRVF